MVIGRFVYYSKKLNPEKTRVNGGKKEGFYQIDKNRV